LHVAMLLGSSVFRMLFVDVVVFGTQRFFKTVFVVNTKLFESLF